MIGSFIIKEDAEVCLNENEFTPDAEFTPVIETEVEMLPIIEAEIEGNASSDDCDKYSQDLKILALKIAELEDKFAKLEIKLNSPVEKQKKRKRGKRKLNANAKVK